jgi:uncharacterized protein DUF2383
MESKASVHVPKESAVRISRRCSRQLPDAVPRALPNWKLRFEASVAPRAGGSVRGSMHRAWTNIKSAITGINEHAVLAECERDEDAAKHAYEAALSKICRRT